MDSYFVLVIEFIKIDRILDKLVIINNKVIIVSVVVIV